MTKIRHFFGNQILTLCFTAFLGVAFTGCSGTADNALYLVILGDSLSVGTQPDAGGTNMTTDRGYGDVLYQMLLPRYPNLQLVKLGCLNDPGETTLTFIEGGSCDYPEGSQLDAAKNFLLEHGENTILTTIDMGVNDLLQSGCIDTGPPLNVDAACVEDFLKNVLPSRLSFIMSELFQVQAETGVPIFGLNYYNPFVVVYFSVYQVVAQGIKDAILNDPAIIGPIQTQCTSFCTMVQPCTPFSACVPTCVQECVTTAVGDIIAQQAPQKTVDIVVDLGIDDLAQAFNFQVLQGVYDLFEFPVVDIYSAFNAGDFTLAPAPAQFAPITMAPVNALSACALTFMCPDQNIHASDQGYQVMAQAVFDLFNTVFPP
ncbi:MAG: hypothetical protein IT572_11825 [Deltaproteobacteria bacterium]|nr:hypothetical protein [Deltaproteobacteria bacterium]